MLVQWIKQMFKVDFNGGSFLSIFLLTLSFGMMSAYLVEDIYCDFAGQKQELVQIGTDLVVSLAELEGDYLGLHKEELDRNPLDALRKMSQDQDLSPRVREMAFGFHENLSSLSFDWLDLEYSKERKRNLDRQLQTVAEMNSKANLVYLAQHKAEKEKAEAEWFASLISSTSSQV